MSAEMTKNWIELAPGVRRKTVAVGDKMMQVVIWFAKGAKVAEHSHINEQVTGVLTGKMRFVIDGNLREAASGESVLIRSNLRHGAEALEESWLLETFSPVREDMLAKDREHEQKLVL